MRQRSPVRSSGGASTAGRPKRSSQVASVAASATVGSTAGLNSPTVGGVSGPPAPWDELLGRGGVQRDEHERVAPRRELGRRRDRAAAQLSLAPAGVVVGLECLAGDLHGAGIAGVPGGVLERPPQRASDVAVVGRMGTPRAEQRA